MKGKQWLLDQFNKVRERYEAEHKQKTLISVERLNLIGKMDTLDEVTNLIEQLDEPQKPVVPKYIADYIEWYNGQNITTRNQEVMVQEFIHPVMLDYPQKEKVIEYGSKQAFRMLRALFNGYTVEEEPKYIIQFPSNEVGTPVYGSIFTIMGEKKMCFVYDSTGVTIRPNRYTRDEIREVGERYWEFAKRVDN